MRKLLKKSVKRFINKLGYSIRRTDQPFNFEAFLYLHLRNNEDLFFIQIGACDGISFDPLYQFVSRNHEQIRGIVVEPLNDYYRELQLNYKRYPNVIPVNAAIHNEEKEMILYRVDPAKMENLPKWAKGISSFNQNHHKLSGISSDVIIGEKVQCISFNKLLKDWQIEKIDLLQVDTEGYDAEIILNIDFNAIKPKIIRFEHGFSCGTMSKEKLLRVVDVLHKNDYELAFEDFDATAYQKNIFLDL